MTARESSPIAPVEAIQQLRKQIEEITGALRSQQELLRIRGMSLPPGALQSIAAIQSQLARLEASQREDERELNQLRALVATSAIINSSLDLDTVLANAMDELIRLTGAERGYILLKNWETGEVEFRVARELDLDTPPGGPYQISMTILNEVLETGQPLLSDNAYKDPQMQGSEAAHGALRSVLCVPLLYRERLIGAVYVDNRLRVAVFTERELKLLTAFANQIAVAIENARLFSNLQATIGEITEMKELMENVFASIGSGVITTDAANLVMTFNQAAARILQKTSDMALGKPLPAVLPRIAADLDEHLAAVRDQNRSVSLEATPELPGRGRVVLNLKLSPLKDAEQQTQGVTMVLDDLTDMREREQLINLMRRYLPPGMMENIHHISGLALGGERREITCLFADVCPLPTFPANLSPAEIMDLLNVYMEHATEAIHSSNGLIDKYMGSEMMVLFNTPLNPMADHALQAAKAALALRQAVVRVYETLGMSTETHFYRIGVHTGVATLGNVGSTKRRSFTAIGDTINLAKRLQEYAGNGQIIVSEDTVRYIERAGGLNNGIRCAERGTLQAKGRQQLTPIYEVFAS